VVRSPGFEPGSSAWQFSNAIDWDAFEEWLNRDHIPRVSRYMRSYAVKFQDCLFQRDFSKLLGTSRGKKRMVMNSLSALVKYLGLYEEFKRLVKEHGLTWGGRSADDIVIERLTKVKNPNEVFEWIKRVKKERPDLTVFMDFIAVTGLRLVEALNSYNLTIALSRKGKLGEYYNAELETLEHYKFKDIFLRKQKKAFASFVPKELVERITVCERLPSTDGIIKRVRKSGLPSRFSDVREAHASFMTSYLRQSEIDFLHGRVTANVFMSNYFNPMLIPDLKQRVFRGIAEIQNKIS